MFFWLTLRWSAKPSLPPGSPRSGARSAAAQAESGAPQAGPPVLPAHWPIPELSLPPGCSAARLAKEASPLRGADNEAPYLLEGVPFNRGSEDSGRIYGLGLHLPGGFGALTAHVERQLSPLGYSEHWHSERPDGTLGREYISPDRMFIVQVFYWPETDNCHLEIFAYDSGDLRTDKSFT